MMKDQFNKDYESTTKLDKNVEQLLKQRRELVAQNRPTGKVDSMLRGQMDQFEIELKTLEKNLFNIDASSYGSQTSMKDKMRKKELIQELRGKYNFQKDRMQEELSSTTQLFHKPQNYERGEDGETDQTRGVGNKGLYSLEQEMIKKQDEDLDELHGHILNIKYAGQAIGKEADVHNKLLDNLEDDIDQTTATMIVVDGKLKNLIAKSSNCCLFCIITLEVAGIILAAVLI